MPTEGMDSPAICAWVSTVPEAAGVEIMDERFAKVSCGWLPYTLPMVAPTS